MILEVFSNLNDSMIPYQHGTLRIWKSCGPYDQFESLVTELGKNQKIQESLTDITISSTAV